MALNSLQELKLREGGGGQLFVSAFFMFGSSSVRRYDGKNATSNKPGSAELHAGLVCFMKNIQNPFKI